MKALASRSHKSCLLHGARQLFHVCCNSSWEIWLFDQTSHRRSRTRKEVIENCPVKRSEIKAVKYKAARLFTVLHKYYLEVPWQKVDIERETYKIRFRQENCLKEWFSGKCSHERCPNTSKHKIELPWNEAEPSNVKIRKILLKGKPTLQNSFTLVV